MSTDADAIQKILTLATPNIHTVGQLEFTDKKLDLIYPPAPKAVECTTLQGLVDLFLHDLDDVMPDKVLVHITSPTTVELISKDSDAYGRRRQWAEAVYPGCECFKFGQWLNPENFLISAQQGFQRVKIEKDDGSFAPDLDYVLKVASSITAENAISHEDDGFAQRVAVKQGITLKAETVLKPTVNLAPYRTFAEIDQVLSQFVFRARIGGESVQLALFEGDGGRWKLGAVAAIKAWLQPKFGAVPVIS
jgi:hypothetical protein